LPKAHGHTYERIEMLEREIVVIFVLPAILVVNNVRIESILCNHRELDIRR